MDRRILACLMLLAVAAPAWGQSAGSQDESGQSAGGGMKCPGGVSVLSNGSCPTGGKAAPPAPIRQKHAVHNGTGK